MSSVSLPHHQRNERRDGWHYIGVEGFTSILPALLNLPDFFILLPFSALSYFISPSGAGSRICSHEQETWSLLQNVL